MAEIESNTPYDDVYRTMYVECDELVLPLLNEIFQKHYTGKERIIRRGNEHFSHQQDGAEEKRITDSFLEVLSDTPEKYHIECESRPDDTILIRMFQYGSQLALEDATITENTLHVTFPHAAVLCLRDPKNKMNQMNIQIHTPHGELAYPIRVCKISDYSMEEMFQRRLYFFIPFYIFQLEKQLAEYEADMQKRTELEQIYQTIIEHLNNSVAEGALTSFTKELLRDLTKKVVWHIARKYETVKERIGEIMGGRVLDLEVIRIRNEGRLEGKLEGKAEGRLEGRAEGKAEGRAEGEQAMQTDIIKHMLDKGKRAEEISDLTGISLENIVAIQKNIV